MSVDKYARKCEVTGKGMNEGFVIGDGFYMANEEDLISHLRGLKWEEVDTTSMNDDELKKYFYDEEYYYYTEWDEVDEDFYYTADGEYIETL